MKGKDISIVIADDDLDDHYFLTQAIKQVNIQYNCTSVYNGLELMDLLLKKGAVPDLIILDLNMPLLDGFGALEQIRANKKLKDIPIYILSTTHFEYDINKSKELGANDFYSKPYHYDKLKDIVDDIFSKTTIFQSK
jgi:CheY-like chemotaxis protein